MTVDTLRDVLDSAERIDASEYAALGSSSGCTATGVIDYRGEEVRVIYDASGLGQYFAADAVEVDVTDGEPVMTFLREVDRTYFLDSEPDYDDAYMEWFIQTTGWYAGEGDPPPSPWEAYQASRK